MNLYTFPTGASPHPALALSAEESAAWLLKQGAKYDAARQALAELGAARANGYTNVELVCAAEKAVAALSRIANRSVWPSLAEEGRRAFVGYMADEVYSRG